MVAKLRDIKGIVEVSDYSLYYLIALIILALLIIAVIVYILVQPKKSKKATSKEIALKKLKEINYDNSKEIAYIFTLNIPFFINDKNRQKIDETLKKLEIYKYKKETLDMDENLKNDILQIIKEVI
ncbi:MAG: hypothetical protein GXP61_08705 [Epsilonproteobacteria bacterium]|nr:hypothetical protein [Campylobacterota bacterium]